MGSRRKAKCSEPQYMDLAHPDFASDDGHVGNNVLARWMVVNDDQATGYEGP